MVRLCVASLALIAAIPAFAQDSPPPETIDTNMVTVGAGVALVPDYVGSRDSKVVPVPGARISLDGFGLTLAGNRGWADLVPDNRGVKGFDWQLGPLANLNLNRSRKVSDPQVAALGKVPVAIEAGAQAGVAYQGLITSAYDRLSLTVGYVHDIGSVHKSYVITPAITYSTPLSRKLFISVSGAADFAGRGFARRYYGVTPAGAAASGLAPFDPGKGWEDWNAGGVVDIALTGDLTRGLQLVAGGSYTRLLGDFAASPIVRNRNQWIGAVGLAYTF